MVVGTLGEIRQTCNKLDTLRRQVFQHVYCLLYHNGVSLKLIVKIFYVTNANEGDTKVVVTVDLHLDL